MKFHKQYTFYLAIVGENVLFHSSSGHIQVHLVVHRFTCLRKIAILVASAQNCNLWLATKYSCS